VGVKAHVLFSRLLTSDDYWNFLSSDTVTEIASKLRATCYEETLAALADAPHRHELEAAIKSTLQTEAEGFLIHMSSPRDKFFKTLMRRNEAENLKSIFRYIASGRANRDELRRRLYMSKRSKIPYDNALSARDFMELSDALRGTVYYKILAEPLRRLHTGEETSLFPLEMALDIFDELSIFKALKKLDASERGRLMPIFGTRADLYNLYILYRTLNFYNMTPEETLNRLLPVRHRITLPALREMARASSPEAITDMIKARFPIYAEIFSSALPDEAPHLCLEKNIKRRVYSQARKVFGDGPPGFHTAVSYYVLKEFEITDVIRIIEYIRYDYERREAAAYLTRPVMTSAGGETEWR
jgi:V/A-type H+-transporting ATPase subunit C